jgi:cold shock CspA family protein
MIEQKTGPGPGCRRLPIRARAKVTSWLGAKGYGFVNAAPTEEQIIFVHAREVPMRPGIGQRLVKGETVIVSYVQQGDGRLRAEAIDIPTH